MQFGKTLVGGIIGAALGIGLLLGVYFALGWDKMWLAIPVALLTGLGVRMVAATSGHASYLRGAITVVIALAAYLGGLAITRAVADHRALNAKQPSLPRAADAAPADPANPDAPADPEKANAPDGEQPAKTAGPDAPPESNIKVTDEVLHRPAMPRQFSTWDFLALAVAALVAYELGRGSGMVAGAPMGSGPNEPMGTHPDA